MLSENAYSRPVTLKNVLRFAVPTIVMTDIHVLLYHGGTVCLYPI